MSPFRWGMMIVGAFLAVYAALTLRGAKAGADRRRTTMGCGFVLLAGLVWGYALGGFLGDFWAGMRLGVAFALVLPALAALASPGRGGIVAAAVMLVLAVVLGAEPFPKLFRRFSTSAPSRLARQVSGALDEARERIDSTQQHAEALEDSRKDLRKQVAALGYGDFDSLAADADAYALLTELAEVDRFQAAAWARLERLQADVPQLESALRRLERFEETEAATGEAVDEAEIEQIVQRLRAEAAEPGLVTVEEHMQREALRTVFEAEFPPSPGE